MADLSELEPMMRVQVNMAGFSQGGVTMGVGAFMSGVVLELFPDEGLVGVQTDGIVAGQNRFKLTPDRVQIVG